MGLTRSIGMVSLIVIGLFFILTAKWRQLLYIFLSVILFFGLFQIIKVIMCGSSGFQFEGQLNGLLLKNFL